LPIQDSQLPPISINYTLSLNLESASIKLGLSVSGGVIDPGSSRISILQIKILRSPLADTNQLKELQKLCGPLQVRQANLHTKVKESSL